MPVAPRDVAGFVRQWASRLRAVGSGELDEHIDRVADELRAMLDEGSVRFSARRTDDPVVRCIDGARLGTELDELAASGQRRPAALMLVDIDGFPVIRDGLGFAAANEVLTGVARTLREIFARQQAFVVRLDGGMFAVALLGDDTTDAVGELAVRIIDRLAEPVWVDGIGVGVSASVGVALADTVAAEHAELVRSAQIALHRAKESGGTRWAMFDPAAGAADRERCRLACGIAGAMAAGELAVVYRPKAVLPDARLLTTLNAGLRWRHPVLGELPPEQFYPLAEATGMTGRLGEYLLAEALRTAADWLARYGDDDAPRVCLNLPRRMAIDGDLVRIVETELGRNGLQPRHITLCTDGPSLVDERGDLLESLAELASAGVTFIVDITGMAELELLPALKVPATAVMLTGQVIEALEIDDPPAWAVRAIRQLVDRAHEIGVQVGAHGVIGQEHAELLAGIGVLVGAGPFVPTHASAAEAEVWAGRVVPAH